MLEYTKSLFIPKFPPSKHSLTHFTDCIIFLLRHDTLSHIIWRILFADNGVICQILHTEPVTGNLTWHIADGSQLAADRYKAVAVHLEPFQTVLN